MFDKRRKHTGFTLIELIVFIVIVSVGLAGVLTSLNYSVMHSADPLQPKQALAIAESLLEEVLLKNYINPSGGYTPTTCSAASPSVASTTCDHLQFDDIGDFVSYSVTPITGYTATVTVDTSAALGAITATSIQVSVTTPNSGTITLTGYRTNY
jgi:MSHA pilin protein MshD